MLRLVLIASLFLSLLSGCKKDDGSNPTPGEASELLVGNNWRATSITTTNGQEINKNRLDLFTQSLFELNMQFRSNGRVNATDPLQANSVVNGGTWTMASDSQSIDVDVTGFKGNFPIVQLTKNKLILRQDDKASVDGQKTNIHIVFDPVL
ncbi:hypothetical protein [Spirosoma sp.]|uniref:hypothetical protein n=1 Tax=Spirosoma sp. TaxID=1899569 RepID=UPI003B3A882B